MNNKTKPQCSDLELSKDISMIMKGFAILFVVLTHLPFDIPFFSLRGLGGWGVSTFLFLSGYGIETSYQLHGQKGFWKKRFYKIYIPFIFAMVIQLIIGLCINTVQIRLLLIPSFLGLYPENVIDGSMWFIPYIFLWYAAFYVTTFFKKSIVTRIFVLLQLSIVIFCVSLLPSFHLGQAYLYFLIFTIGVVFANLNLKSYVINQRILVLVSALFFFTWFGVRYYSTSTINAYLFYSFAPFFVFSLSKLVFQTGIRRLFIAIGKRSYHIYLFESLCIDLAFSSIPVFLCTKYRIEQTSVAVSLFILVLLIAVFVAIASIIEKALIHRKTS